MIDKKIIHTSLSAEEQEDIRRQVQENVAKLQRNGIEKGMPSTPQTDAERHSDRQTAKTPTQQVLFNFDWLTQHRDLITLIGFGLIIYGVSLYSPKAAYVFAGVSLIGIGYLMSV